MPIRSILKNDHAFAPEEAKVLVAAFEEALRELNLTSREDPLTLLVAKHIVELAKAGERDPNRLRERAIQKIGPRDVPGGGSLSPWSSLNR